MLFLLIFIAVPIIEIAAFIKIGDIIGLWSTIACVILTAMIGTFLLRQQGLSVLQKAQGSLQNNQLPLDSVIHGAFLLVAGALLLTPGFFTDAIGFILMIPPARTVIGRYIWERFRGRVHVHHSGMGTAGRRPGGPNSGPGPVIDGEAVEVKTEKREPPRNEEPPAVSKPDDGSPWNR